MTTSYERRDAALEAAVDASDAVRDAVMERSRIGTLKPLPGAPSALPHPGDDACIWRLSDALRRGVI